MQIRRLSYALGAEVTGIDLRQPLDDATISAIRGAWLDNLLLYFPAQKLEKNQLLAFARRFGELEGAEEPPAAAGSGVPSPGPKQGHNWHSDQSNTPRPSEGTFLGSKQIPGVGGDTMFANQYMAYDTLSPKMRAIVDGLWTVHFRGLPVRGFSQGTFDEGRVEYEKLVRTEAEKVVGPHRAQAAVVTHPETKRKALYVGSRARRIVGMSEEEARPLLDFLNQHAVRYEFTYRHRWKADDLLLWDNRCLLHIALCDYDLQHGVRNMIRCRTVAPPAGYPFEPADDAVTFAIPAKVPVPA